MARTAITGPVWISILDRQEAFVVNEHRKDKEWVMDRRPESTSIVVFVMELRIGTRAGGACTVDGELAEKVTYAETFGRSPLGNVQ